jgi:release factor glutamine methyltransferase
MTIHEWLPMAVKKMEQQNDTALLDAEVLLCDELGKNKAWLIAHGEEEIDADRLQSLEVKLTRRIRHEPLAYIRGKQEFYGREFVVDARVLVPRPETETMVELMIEDVKRCNFYPEHTRLLDVGTGSGALGITASLETDIPVTLIDIDTECLELARLNTVKHTVNAEVIQSDLLEYCAPETIKDKTVLILANLPYVPDEHPINQAATLEPRHAIFGGHDGLDVYRRLFSQVEALGSDSLNIYTEALVFQHSELEKIARQSGCTLARSSGLIQIFTLQGRPQAELL